VIVIKTRFAPSPTGALHVGGVRTALFSFLFAKAQGGKFVLRIEDTDQERSTKAHADAIIEAMDWLGLHADEGPVFQSERMERYQTVLTQLLAEGKAYRCTCSTERLDALREQQTQAKQKPRYDGHCRSLNLSAEAGPAVIRLKTPLSGKVSFDDLVYGNITVSNTELDDLVLMRSDGVPTYNFAVVVDDADMQITHVIRGDDHINNTPRQIHVYQALNWSLPQFAHLPMILGEDGKRLSKRHGAVNVLEFREAGFLPEALLNDLVRLGWSHQDQEIFSLAEMIQYFDWAHVSRSPAIFNYEKLNWLNQHYLKTLPVTEVVNALTWQFNAMGIKVDSAVDLALIVQSMVDRAKTLREMAERSRCYVEDAVSYDDAAVEKFLHAGLKEAFELLLTQFQDLSTWDKSSIHGIIEHVCEQLSVGMGKVAQPLRVAVTGGTSSPSIDETLVLVGKQRTLERLQGVLDKWQEAAEGLTLSL
jgi:glutamyl-tRNA synthetase